MYVLTEQQQQQYDWAVAWQDRQDHDALWQLVASVRPLAYRIARSYAFDQDLYEQVLAECTLAAVSAADGFDRTRPSGYVMLSGFRMRDAVKLLLMHRKTPATQPVHLKDNADRVAIIDEPEEGVDGVVLVAEENDPRIEQGLQRFLCELFDAAGLKARERSVLECRYLAGHRRRDMARARDITYERVRQIEQDALAKVRAVAEARGLSLADLL